MKKWGVRAWPVRKEHSDHMRMRRAQNLDLAARNPHENQVAEILAGDACHRWSRQVTWGFRIFDFWCEALGVAIEVDGKTHDPARDALRDDADFRRSAIVVLRVPNGDFEAAKSALSKAHEIGDRKSRRERFGIVGSPKSKRWLVGFQPFRNLHSEWLADPAVERDWTSYVSSLLPTHNT